MLRRIVPNLLNGRNYTINPALCSNSIIKSNSFVPREEYQKIKNELNEVKKLNQVYRNDMSIFVKWCNENNHNPDIIIPSFYVKDQFKKMLKEKITLVNRLSKLEEEKEEVHNRYKNNDSPMPGDGHYYDRELYYVETDIDNIKKRLSKIEKELE